jgi:hypothetical protein
MVIQLYHPTDPRFLLVPELPERVTLDDILNWRFGKVMITAPGPVDVIFEPEGEAGSDWVPR